SIEHDLARIGADLFQALFQANDAARSLWATVRGQLKDARVEIATGVKEATIPWELLRDPATDKPLALRARAFVRTPSPNAPSPRTPRPGRSPHGGRALPASAWSSAPPAGGLTSPSVRGLPACSRPSARTMTGRSDSTCCAPPPSSVSPPCCTRPARTDSPITS